MQPPLCYPEELRRAVQWEPQDAQSTGETQEMGGPAQTPGVTPGAFVPKEQDNAEWCLWNWDRAKRKHLEVSA